jgi:hypothetical protein
VTTFFPERARRDDPFGHMVVQRMLEFLRDIFDKSLTASLRGTATVAQSATTVTVNHNVGTSLYSAVATPTSNPGGSWWVSGKTASQFVINLQTAAPVGGVSFDWTVKGA